MNEISFTPGRLAPQIGLSRSGLLQHLQETGRLNQCCRSPGGHLKIPYSVAVSLASPEALAVQTQTTRTIEVPRRKRVQPEPKNKPPPEQTPAQFPPPVDYAQPGKMLRSAGITLRDVINYFSQERQKNQSTAKEEGVEAQQN